MGNMGAGTTVVTADGTTITRNRTEGYIIKCDGGQAVIAAHAGRAIEASDDYWAVGQLISVVVGNNRVVGLIFDIDVPVAAWDKDGDNIVHIHIELVGEIVPMADETLRFNSGISNYPHMGAIAHRIRAADLAAIYANSDSTTVSVGTLSQDSSIPALITVDKLLSRHFAVVGTTGVGKSTSVTLLLRKIVEERPDIRVLILDPHNEFASAFPKHAITVDASTLDLPFWMFKLDELTEVIFRGRPGVGAEVDALRDLIPLAKERFRRAESNPGSGLIKKDAITQTSFTADTPVPYRMVELLALIEERIGQLEGKADRPYLKSLKNRIESIVNDQRFKFMFGQKTVSDTMSNVLSHVFRIPQNGRPICVFELSGLPSEVMNAVVSVMCRMAFDLGISSAGTIQTLVVCEEAHRYIPADRNAGFWPTRASIARIAKEGRKYGVFLGVITQRPGELDPTILSQCNTVFAMRLGNERDKEIIRQAISGAAKSTISFLSSIANRECIAFGEAIHTPMRMMFEMMRKEDLPGSHIYENQAALRAGGSAMPLGSVIKRMRAEDSSGDEDEADGSELVGKIGEPVAEQRPSVNPAPRLDEAPGRFSQKQGAAEPARASAPSLRKAQEPVAVSYVTPGGEPPLPEYKRPDVPADNGVRPAYVSPAEDEEAKPMFRPKDEQRASGNGVGNLIRSFRAR